MLTEHSDPSAGERFDRLIEIMRRLRAPDGCPWDREQTLESLRPYVLEEAYEVLDAIDRGDLTALRGELGDFLFEAIFLAQICAEQGIFTIADAVQAVTDKLIQRHPHVFGPAVASGEHPPPERSIETSSDVREQWEELKARERAAAGADASILTGVPKILPSLLRAFEIGSRAASVGFDWSHAADVLAKVEEEMTELRRALHDEGHARTEEEIGDLLFAVANLARKLNVEPEAALRNANEKFIRRFQALERRVHRRGQSLQDTALEEMEAEWGRVKDSEI
jgi:MazG family protein